MSRLLLTNAVLCLMDECSLPIAASRRQPARACPRQKAGGVLLRSHPVPHQTLAITPVELCRTRSPWRVQLHSRIWNEVHLR